MLDQSSDGGGGSGDGGYLACWFCSGSGVTSVWTNSIVAPSLDDLLNAEEASDDDDNDDMYDCQICYDSSMFGLSTTCQHFYCVECIRRSLDSMMDAGEFPAYCPACKAEAATGQNGALEARQGRIETRALSFLVHKRVLTREQYFRFKKMQARASNGDEFFPCPKKCGQYLIKQPLELGEKVVKFGDGYRREEKLGKCPCCDCRICMKCLREPNFETRVYDVQVADGKLLEHGQRIQAYREEDKEYHW